MGDLQTAGLTLADIDLGGMDAESDPQLAKYFVTTPYVHRAFAARQHIFLGRKGAGKSSIFTQLPRLADEHGAAGALVLDITPDAYAWSALRSYQEAGVHSEQAHSNAWKLTLAIELGVALLSMNRSWSDSARKGLYVVKDFIGSNFGDSRTRGLRAATGVLKNLQSFNLAAFGFGVGAERGAPAPRTPMTPDIIRALLHHMEPALHEQRVLVAMDRLDDAWDGTSESKSLLIGLLKTAKDLNDEFRASRTAASGLQVLVFLRTDIYDSLTFDDKDKHRPFEEQIVWADDQLRALISMRLPADVSVDELFEPGRMRGSVLPFDHILKRTFLRPREVLQFVDQCLRTAGDDAVNITKENVRSAEERFSSWKVEDLKQEYAKALPELSPLVEALRQQVHRYDSFDELLAVLRAKESHLLEELGERRALEILFETSVIGIRLGGTGSTKFKATSPELSLPSSGVVYVHQSLYKGLNLTETRKSLAGEPTEEDEAVRE